ncbi:hypothetical protein BN7_126 [Wickerhamomyces ciferrii]|uniref:Pumilio domain-containing protein n=1 Tax=Wickerhamomyces ciferrii (strain ATCC 14091 / BCRC 22168 / CBS 111 / JCM 3599 / NBRC 0793 / NRRL Y-1031 F-60-10) TaxID=1206466 RepID=K0KHE2_WICCF|nr:uncharacterized protein BN7_126 [Wickerhamomyces ciferrii]CCH40593.1 hypothetical protein BN7_126 [Wickerhamomyces ciferrii]
MNNSNNNQDAQSFLSVPSDSAEQFPLLSPQRSNSPLSIMSDQLNPQPIQQSNTGTSNLGSFRSRTRAGTLPSRFNANSLAPPTSNASSSNSAISPNFNAYDPNSLNIETLSISNSTNGSNFANGTQTGRPRLRSGSLLGLSESNSIWSTDQQPISSATSTNQTAPALSTVNFMSDRSSPTGAINNQSRLSISPTKTQFQNAPVLDDSLNRVDVNRARAYSTNNALINDSSTDFYLQNFLTLDEEKSYQSPNQQTQQNNQIIQDPQQQIQQQQILPQQQQHQGFGNRPRAQTYQNGADASLPIQYNFASNSIFETPEYEKSQSHIAQHSFLKDQPLLLDDIDPRFLNCTSTYQDPSLGPTNTLFLSNLPPQAVSPLSLANLLIKFGKLSSVRILKGNENAIVEFENIDSAMQAKAQLNHQELMPGFACLVGFAKLLPATQIQPTVGLNDGSPGSLSSQPSQEFNLQQQQPNQQSQNQSQQSFVPQILVQQEDHAYSAPVTINEEPQTLEHMVKDLYQAVKKLGIAENSGTIQSIVNRSLDYEGFSNDFGPLPEPLPIREYDAPKLRETRKLIDSNSLTQFDIEELSIAMLDELPELSSDYLGNTIVQKLFEFSSESIKCIMLKEVAPFLAQMGIHKNGTWSAQKMITVADTPIQKRIVAESLKPYCVPLLNDQFGNYVIQCSLKFGSPWNDFIFEVILARFWEIAQNRFGARAVRACLESHEATVEQTALISAAIILHAEHLAINQNAALLITWFLDTCTLPNRHVLLAPRLIPHLAQLCTHKLASLTVLKILNHRGENDAKGLILNAIFGVQDGNTQDESSSRPPETLEQILHDNVHGATFIFKVISNPLLESDTRQHVISQVRRVLLELNVSSYQGYKRLMDEVGLSNRGDNNRHNRTHSNGGSNGRKNRQNKSSPQGIYNRRSTPNGGFRNQQLPPSLISPSQPQQYLPQQGFYEDPQQQPIMNDYQNQFYSSQIVPPLPQAQVPFNGFYNGDNLGSFDPQPKQVRAPLQQPSGFEDPFVANPYNNGPNDRNIYQQQPQYGYGAAQF